MMNVNDMLTEDIAKIVDYLDKAIGMVKECGIETREQDIAIQKLEEAIFWLTYGTY